MSFRTCEKGLKYTRQIIQHNSLENVVYLKCSQSAECMPVVTVITHFLFWPSWEITDLESSNLNVRIFVVSKVLFLFFPSGSSMYCVSFFSVCSEHILLIWPCSPKVVNLLEIHNISHFLCRKSSYQLFTDKAEAELVRVKHQKIGEWQKNFSLFPGQVFIGCFVLSCGF